MTNELLKAPEVADQLRVSVGTLANWRHQGIGPRYIKLSPSGRVRYMRADVDAYLNRTQGDVAA
ncbi:helix-turn-helix domain-containing protein [Streptomyces flavotricini]|uniref:Helix-turn-helix domain-containing protein n=1 Tax=Streptomyces flavotricini TaxID=66888 RepID=A0ABS8EED6_9ACTN|nr:helix-turn-helix domain-containing protein [Streptomyces flavotricini]MCC0099436.1 helix-turn-helix domain-containing protein [Streptomyces flavotricini]